MAHSNFQILSLLSCLVAAASEGCAAELGEICSGEAEALKASLLQQRLDSSEERRLLVSEVSEKEESGVVLADVRGNAENMDYAESPPKKVGFTEYDWGQQFEVWKFPLQQNNATFYYRRFGVDVPLECRKEGVTCPLLLDFHGSYDSLYSQRAFTTWYRYLKHSETKFILLTPEGSPDGLGKEHKILNDCNESSKHCVGSSMTSWNVLGWGIPTDYVQTNETCDKADNAHDPTPNCFWTAVEAANAYNCFQTHLDANPNACKPVSKHGNTSLVPAVCMSASGARDSDYMHQMLSFVTQNYQVDTNRIYFTGQSMGGMSSLQFAVRDGKYSQSPDLRPAAVVPCSAGGARSAVAQLHGEVPTLLMWGYRDDIAPPTPWNGYVRDGRYLGNNQVFFEEFMKNKTLVQRAMQLTGGLPSYDCGCTWHGITKSQEKTCCLIQWANVLSGGELLDSTDQHRKLLRNKSLSCVNNDDQLTAVGGSGFMWEGISSTLNGIAGRVVKMADLSFQAPTPDTDFVPENLQKEMDILCSDVQSENENNPIKVCVFNGGHTYPWNGGVGFNNASKANTFHDFVWKGFLKGGTLTRDKNELKTSLLQQRLASSEESDKQEKDSEASTTTNSTGMTQEQIYCYEKCSGQYKDFHNYSNVGATWDSNLKDCQCHLRYSNGSYWTETLAWAGERRALTER